MEETARPPPWWSRSGRDQGKTSLNVTKRNSLTDTENIYYTVEM